MVAELYKVCKFAKINIRLIFGIEWKLRKRTVVNRLFSFCVYKYLNIIVRKRE